MSLQKTAPPGQSAGSGLQAPDRHAVRDPSRLPASEAG
jgi:hypothetical protein